MSLMRFLLVSVLFVAGLVGVEPTTFHLTNDARFVATLERLLAAQPGTTAYPEAEFQWLFAVATAADRARRYEVAEAAMTVITTRWPYLTQPWGGLSCFQGKQGKFTEALDSVAHARKLPRHDRQQLDGIAAVWLWQLGRRDEATALLTALPQPKAGDSDYVMSLVCSAFFHASCDHDQGATRRAMETILALPDVGHWRYFFTRDVAFDALRHEPWFKSLLGDTAEGQAPEQPFQPCPMTPAVDLILRLASRPEERLARSEIVSACAHLGTGAWTSAAEAADRALQHAELPEAYVIKAMALAGLDQPGPAMDAIRQISHQGFDVGSWPMDLDLVVSATRTAIRRLITDVQSGTAAKRSVALGIIIDCHFVCAWREYADAIRMLQAASAWCPTLAEVPNTRALARMDQEDWVGVEADLQAAIRLNPNFADAYLNLACLRKAQGNPTEGLALFEDAKRHGDTYPGTELQGCLFLGAVGRLDDALAIITAGQAQATPHRSFAGTCWELSSQFSEHRRYADAERLTRLVISHAPAWSDAWTKLSGDLARQGKFAEAVECAQRHLDSHPDACDGQLAVACYLVHLGRRDEAAAIVAKVHLPEDQDRLSLYHSCRALYAAALGDESGVRTELTAVMLGKHRLRQIRWIRSDCLLDAYHDKPWFVELTALSGK